MNVTNYLLSNSGPDKGQWLFIQFKVSNELFVHHYSWKTPKAVLSK